jgi:uncharacterized protein
MAGTKQGGVAAASTNKNRYGSDFYANRELARAAGAKGGRISRRTTKKDA